MNKKNRPLISIIIRTFNEEKWLYYCLTSIFNQSFQDFEVIIVDNYSKDNSLNIVKRFPIKKIVKIKKFLPGKALNIGIKLSQGDYIVCISSHCIPFDNYWLKYLLKAIEGNKKIAGCYGRQIPMPFTSDDDKRDLLITFGQDKKTQIREYFFHNANSIIRRDILIKYPFDNNVTNIEDRVWGKTVIESGYLLVYEPKASVFHHHGLHQHEKSSLRAGNIAKILNKTDPDSSSQLPDSYKPENINICAFLFLEKEISTDSMEFDLLKMAIADIKSSKYIKTIYLISPNNKISKVLNINWINRKKGKFQKNNLNLEDMLSLTLRDIEMQGDFPELILYVNHLYPFRPKNIFNQAVEKIQHSGCDTVFAAYLDYGNYWSQNEDSYQPVNFSLNRRSKKIPAIRALYGIGCVVRPFLIRQKKLIGYDVGVIPFDNYKYTLMLKNKGTKEIIKKLL